MSCQYLIFDLDNTLYPKKSGLLNHIDRRVDAFIGEKLKITPDEIAKLRKEYGKQYGSTLGGMVARHRIDPAEYINYAYNVNVADFLKPDRALAEILGTINIKKSVFSNSPLRYVEEVLEVLKIRPYFEKIFDIEFCNYIGKPNRSSFLRVLADLGIQGKECLLIDDLPTNVLGAERVGIKSILLSPVPEANIKWIIRDLSELPRIIPKIQNQLSA